MRLLLGILTCALAAAEQVAFHDPSAVTAPPARSIPVPLGEYYNNRGTSSPSSPADGMDGGAYPAHLLPTGRWSHEGVDFVFPAWGDAQDNIRADGQRIAVPPTEARAIHLVAAGEGSGGFNLGNTHEHLGLLFEDGSTGEVPFLVKTWWAHHWTNKAPIRTPFQYRGAHEVYNASHLFHTVIPLPAELQARVTGVVLPRPREHNSLHVFALTLEPVGRGEMMAERIVAPFATATRRWEDLSEEERRLKAVDRGQVVVVAVRNPLSAARHADPDAWIDRPVHVRLRGAAFDTVREGYVPRLMPGDEVRVEVLVAPTGAGDFDDARVEFSVGEVSWSVPVRVEGSALVRDFSEWTSDEADVEQHTAPGWYNRAKFGIFIHWGLFAVPAWAPVPRYAEWYDFWIHDDKPGMEAYEHHLNTWGKDFVYDDFIALFKADKFDASEWTQLVADAGAKYFVFTRKHHDGYALFDTKGTSERNSLLLGPKKDFLRDLMDTAAREHPDIKRGTYFSMPEWFNPLYKPHGRVSFPGGPAYNPFKPGEVEPYTGHVDVGDYISGIQVPQMRILADDYKTDMIWCDIGLANDSARFVADWYASAAREGRQVAISNRCGIGGDFDTPEMEKFGAVEMNKWESCASMDPFSFGYSADTPDDAYRNATDVVHTLVDITAKGGNFLLNIGPRADGSIPEAMAQPLREAGRWLKLNGRAIYDTVPFPLLPEVKTDSVHVQLTRTDKSLFIISLNDLKPQFELKAPLPILPCDEIVFVAEGGDVTVPWGFSDSVLRIDLSALRESDYTGRIAYVLEVRYGQCA